MVAPTQQYPSLREDVPMVTSETSWGVEVAASIPARVTGGGFGCDAGYCYDYDYDLGLF